MKVELTLEDLAQIVCDGNIEGELQDRVAEVIRTDPRFTRQFEELAAIAAEVGAEDLWEGLERNEEFDQLLEAESWDDPAEVLNPKGSDLYVVSYRKLLAVADTRIAKAEAPAPIQAVKDRLLRAEKKPAEDAVFQVAVGLLRGVAAGVSACRACDALVAMRDRDGWSTRKRRFLRRFRRIPGGMSGKPLECRAWKT